VKIADFFDTVSKQIQAASSPLGVMFSAGSFRLEKAGDGSPLKRGYAVQTSGGVLGVGLQSLPELDIRVPLRKGIFEVKRSQRGKPHFDKYRLKI
jgi:hypothetical protein